MAFADLKKQLKKDFENSIWQEIFIKQRLTEYKEKRLLSSLFSLLLHEKYYWKAVWCFGKIFAKVAMENPSGAQDIIHRLLWSLNEESGNVAWGSPEAMGAALAESPLFLKQYAKILFSYIWDTGIEDNYLDFSPLRGGVYWSIGQIALKTQKNICQPFSVFIQACCQEDIKNSAFAVWALRCLYQQNILSLEEKRCVETHHEKLFSMKELFLRENLSVQILDGNTIRSLEAKELGIFLDTLFNS